MSHALHATVLIRDVSVPAMTTQDAFGVVQLNGVAVGEEDTVHALLSLGRAYETTSRTPAENRQKTSRTPSVKLQEKTPGNQKRPPLDWKHTPHNSESVLVESYSVHRNTNVGKQSIQTCTQSDVELNIHSNSSYGNSANVKHVKSGYSR